MTVQPIGSHLRFGQTRILIVNTLVRQFPGLIKQVHFGSSAAVHTNSSRMSAFGSKADARRAPAPLGLDSLGVLCTVPTAQTRVRLK